MPWTFSEHVFVIAGELIGCCEAELLGDGTDGGRSQLLLFLVIHQQLLHLLKLNLFEQLYRGAPELFTAGFGD